MVRETLQKLNLNAGEAQIYELLLREGPLRALAISKITGIGRANAYRLLNQLEEKKLIIKSDQVGVARFSARHPSALQEYLFTQRQAIDAAQIALTPAMESMMSMFRLSAKVPGVYVFNGKEELKRSYDQLLKEGLDIDIIMNRTRFRTFLGDYNKKFVSMRMRKKIHTRVITPGNPRVATDDVDTTELRQVRYLNERLFPFDMDLKATKRHVVITTLTAENCVGVFISDAEIARNFGIMFNFLWSMAEGGELPRR